MKPVAGFTLIEILVAIAIFAIVVTVASSITTSLTMNGGSRDILTVNQAAQTYIESLSVTWKDKAQFGAITSATPVPTTPINGFKASVTICALTAASFADTACSATFVWNPDTLVWTATPTTSTSVTTGLAKVVVTYTKATKSYVNSTELALRP